MSEAKADVPAGHNRSQSQDSIHSGKMSNSHSSRSKHTAHHGVTNNVNNAVRPSKHISQSAVGHKSSSKHQNSADDKVPTSHMSHWSSKHPSIDDHPDQVLAMMNELGLPQTDGSGGSQPVQFGGPQPGPVPPFQQPINMQSPQQGAGFGINDWEEREELKQRELDEARARVAQMEKTMRWWSDCTTNWREKWSKVRNERNKSREECRQLRTKLEAAVKEMAILKREKHELLSENDKLNIEISKLQKKNTDEIVLAQKDNESVDSLKNEVVSSEASTPREHDVDSDRVSSQDGYETPEQDLPAKHPSVSDEPLLFLDKVLQKKDPETLSVKSERLDLHRRQSKFVDMPTPDDNMAERKIAAMEMRLNEAQKTIKAERDDKNLIVKTIEKLQSELSSMKVKYDDLKKSKQDALHELTKVRDEHSHQVSRIALELEDESSSRYNMDKTINDLRMELEKLQAENASEWGKRERIETEKLALERENKKLRTNLLDLTEELDKKQKESIDAVDSDMKTLQENIYDATKELNDLKHVNHKLKKQMQDKSTELEHSKRRAEQYDMEVKRLRSRIEELKRDLASAEDEIDSQSNTIRKLQRTDDELQEQVEGQKVQLDHLETRLKRSSQPFDIFKKGGMKSLSLDNPNHDESEDDED